MNPNKVYKLNKKELKFINNMIVEEMEKFRPSPIDEQTIMFWNLQLQFMEMDYLDLADIHHLILHGCFRSTPAWKTQDLLATELALQLSGLA